VAAWRRSALGTNLLFAKIARFSQCGYPTAIHQFPDFLFRESCFVHESTFHAEKSVNNFSFATTSNPIPVGEFLTGELYYLSTPQRFQYGTFFF